MIFNYLFTVRYYVKINLVARMKIYKLSARILI